MHYRITHTTAYEYAAPVGRCYNLAHCLPRNTQRQTCLKSRVRVTPEVSFSHERRDYFGNRVFYFSIANPHGKLTITSESELLISSPNQLPSLALGNSCAYALEQLRLSRDPEVLMAREYLLDSPMVRVTEALRAYAQSCFSPDKPLLAAVSQLSERIYREFTYDPGFTNLATPLAEVLEHKRGVCQDFAHLAIGCLRALGYPARYISGYLETLPPPGQPKLVGADASHAWFAVFSPGEGWFEFDPTNNQIPAEQHILTAWGRDYSDVPPLSGVIFGGGDSHLLTVGVTVESLQEAD
jgi:transglutaminase-like putative cysteine protease